jgi:hypothetical protein
LYLGDRQLAKLKELAQQTGLTVSELIRRAVDRFLKGEKKQ